MEYEPKNRKQRHRRGKAWEFTFVGETPTKPNKRGNNQGELGMQQVFPLSTTKVGDRLVITQIQSGRSMVYRLNNMGLTVGCEVQVISKTTSGSVIIRIQDKEIGLGTAMADRVMVAFATESSRR
ncbi:MAG: FeoA family protein [Calothrix sp. MO_167.B42]|nr:FeoA family protein [Calothrix sp. MO_167.B42]